MELQLNETLDKLDITNDKLDDIHLGKSPPLPQKPREPDVEKGA